ncbi:baseplate J/gp47 family protein [Bacillaceae bacterium IKA-2]|nr:baseplate J/gp47 family protein [Bacillaceae bacterium IKA-2]
MQLNNLPDVSFAKKDAEIIINELISDYEQAFFEQTGQRKKLYPGDPIRIFLYSQALREFQLRQVIDFSAKQNLLKYSQGEYLENLAASRPQRVERLEDTKARVSVKFVLSSVQPVTITIPIGTRAGPGNDIYFETIKNVDIPAGESETIVTTECLTAGVAGNNFTPGQINVLIDPLPWVESVTNTETSQGGAEREDDESLRERIWLAPESYSVAGPEGAYIFFAKEYSSTIEDVVVTSPSGGVIDIRVLLSDGEIPETTFLEGLKSHLSAKDKRPLTDNVITGAPEQVGYNIDLTYYIPSFHSSQNTTIQENVSKAIEDFVKWQKTKQGRDINPSELISRIIQAGAKRVDVQSPNYRQLDKTEVAKAETININYGGLEDD